MSHSPSIYNLVYLNSIKTFFSAFLRLFLQSQRKQNFVLELNDLIRPSQKGWRQLHEEAEPQQKVWKPTKSFLVIEAGCVVSWRNFKFHRNSKVWAHQSLLYWKFVNKPRHHEKISHSREALNRILERSPSFGSNKWVERIERKGSKNLHNEGWIFSLPGDGMQLNDLFMSGCLFLSFSLSNVSQIRISCVHTPPKLQWNEKLKIVSLLAVVRLTKRTRSSAFQNNQSLFGWFFYPLILLIAKMLCKFFSPQI